MNSVVNPDAQLEGYEMNSNYNFARNTSQDSHDQNIWEPIVCIPMHLNKCPFIPHVPLHFIAEITYYKNVAPKR